MGARRERHLHRSRDGVGLGAMGEAGVTRALEIIRNELDLTMAFCGKTRLADVDRGILLAPGNGAAR